MAGNKPNMPANGHTWKNVPGLNRNIWEKYKGFSNVDAIKLLDVSYKNIQELIERHSDQELFEKKKYNGGVPLHWAPTSFPRLPVTTIGLMN